MLNVTSCLFINGKKRHKSVSKKRDVYHHLLLKRVKYKSHSFSNASHTPLQIK